MVILKVDLETKCEGVKDKSKYIDITCGFFNKINCAVELKFKTQKQSAQDLGRIDAYVDLEALEIMVLDKERFNFGKFYMITNSSAYTKPFKGKIASDFKTHDTHITEAGQQFVHSSSWKNGQDIIINLKNSYIFNWEKVNKNGKDWYFIELTINKI